MIENIKNLIDSKVSEFSDKYIAPAYFSDKPFYTSWCAQTYHYVSHSARLLHKAGEATEDEFFKKIFLSHEDEEAGHENLAKVDYKNLGAGLVKEFPQFPSTHTFWSHIDKKIDENPLNMLGYALCLEFLAAKLGGDLIDQAKVFGDKCILFLKEHYEVDQHHTTKLLETLERLPQEDLKAIYESTVDSFKHYFSIIDECIDYSKKRASA